MKNTMENSKPGAWVVSSKDRGRKSIKKGKVYLKDKENFEIELYNPLNDSVLADIKINKNSISENGLIIKPGQRVYLDCFIDDKKKFVFETYEVEDSNESKNAIQNNGLVEVFFYKESITNFNIPFNHHSSGTWTYPYWTYPYTGQIYYGNSTTPIGTSLTNNIGDSSNSITNISTNTTNTTINGSNYGGMEYLKSSVSNTETGRVEKGDSSEQQFDKVSMNFDRFKLSSTVIQLLPESKKPVEVAKNKKPKTDVDVTELLSKLHNLYQSDVITEEEFSNKKKELLNRI